MHHGVRFANCTAHPSHKAPNKRPSGPSPGGPVTPINATINIPPANRIFRMLRFTASAIAILLALTCIPHQSAAPSPEPLAQPRIDWIGDRAPQDAEHIMYRDTDRDGQDEVIFWSYSSLSVYDPPSLKRVLFADWLQDFEGPVF